MINAWLTRHFVPVNYALLGFNGTMLGMQAYQHHVLMSLVSAVGCAICTWNLVKWWRYRDALALEIRVIITNNDTEGKQ